MCARRRYSCRTGLWAERAESNAESFIRSSVGSNAPANVVGRAENTTRERTGNAKPESCFADECRTGKNSQADGNNAERF